MIKVITNLIYVIKEQLEVTLGKRWHMEEQNTKCFSYIKRGKCDFESEITIHSVSQIIPHLSTLPFCSLSPVFPHQGKGEGVQIWTGRL